MKHEYVCVYLSFFSVHHGLCNVYSIRIWGRFNSRVWAQPVYHTANIPSCWQSVGHEQQKQITFILPFRKPTKSVSEVENRYYSEKSGCVDRNLVLIVEYPVLVRFYSVFAYLANFLGSNLPPFPTIFGWHSSDYATTRLIHQSSGKIINHIDA